MQVQQKAEKRDRELLKPKLMMLKKGLRLLPRLPLRLRNESSHRKRPRTRRLLRMLLLRRLMKRRLMLPPR